MKDNLESSHAQSYYKLYVNPFIQLVILVCQTICVPIATFLWGAYLRLELATVAHFSYRLILFNIFLFISSHAAAVKGDASCGGVPLALSNITSCSGNVCDVYSTATTRTNLATGSSVCYNFTSPSTNILSPIFIATVERVYVYYPEIYNYNCFDYTTPCNIYTKCGVIPHSECTSGSSTWGNTNMRWHGSGRHTTVGCPVSAWRDYCYKCWVNPGKSWKVVKVGTPSVKIEVQLTVGNFTQLLNVDANTPFFTEIDGKSITMLFEMETFTQLTNKHILVTSDNKYYVVESTRSINLPNQITSLTNICSLQSKCGVEPYCWNKQLLEAASQVLITNTDRSLGNVLINNKQSIEMSIPQMLTIPEYVPGLNYGNTASITSVNSQMKTDLPTLQLASLYESDLSSEKSLSNDAKSVIKKCNKGFGNKKERCMTEIKPNKKRIVKQSCDGSSVNLYLSDDYVFLYEALNETTRANVCLDCTVSFMEQDIQASVTVKNGIATTLTSTALSGILMEVTKVGNMDITVVSKDTITFTSDKVCPRITKISHNENSTILYVTAYSSCQSGIGIISSNDSSIIPSQSLELRAFSQVFEIPLLRTYDSGNYTLLICHKSNCNSMNFTFTSTKIRFDTLEDRLADIVNWKLLDTSKHDGLEKTLMEWVNTLWIWVLIYVLLWVIYFVYSCIAYPLSFLCGYLYAKFGKGYVSGIIELVGRILYYTSSLTFIVYCAKAVIQFTARRFSKKLDKAVNLTPAVDEERMATTIMPQATTVSQSEPSQADASSLRQRSSSVQVQQAVDITETLSSPQQVSMYKKYRGNPIYNYMSDMQIAEYVRRTVDFK